MASLARRVGTLSALKVFGPDRKGIVAASSELLNRCGFSAVQSEHYTDRSEAMFFQRILFDTARRIDRSELDNMADGLRDINQKFGVVTELDWRQTPKRVAILVSRHSHCLWELLLRYQADELQQCEIPLVISNHDDCRRIAEDMFSIPFVVFPITQETKTEQEQKELELLKQHEIDVIVLARYMQVLSDDFLNEYPGRIINIHHSFLPAFSGGKAYHQAHERGVKLIGAT
jgi:formyltetrahydrofolate deformylase